MCTGIPCESRRGVIRLKEGVVGVSEVQQCHTGFLLPAEEFTQRRNLVRHIKWGKHTSLAAGQRYWAEMYLSASSNCMEIVGCLSRTQQKCDQ